MQAFVRFACEVSKNATQGRSARNLRGGTELVGGVTPTKLGETPSSCDNQKLCQKLPGTLHICLTLWAGKKACRRAEDILRFRAELRLMVDVF
jgi:hypothetical protein